MKFDMPDGVTQIYPVDLVAALQLEVAPAAEQANGSVMPAVVRDFLFVQAYNYVRLGSLDHPSVPGSKYMYLTDEFHLLTPEVVVGPALLVPNLSPDPVALRRWSNGAIGPRVARPHFFWLDKDV